LIVANIVSRAAVDIWLASDVPLRDGHPPKHGELDLIRSSVVSRERGMGWFQRKTAGL